LDNHLIDFENEPKFGIFIKMIREKSLNLYKDLPIIAMKHGKESSGILILISTKVISILAKIGE
jgi:hypothetical protein